MLPCNTWKLEGNDVHLFQKIYYEIIHGLLDAWRLVCSEFKSETVKFVEYGSVSMIEVDLIYLG